MNIKQLIGKVGFLEAIGIALLLFIAASGYLFLSPKSSDVTVTVRLADKDLIWLDSGSPKGIPAEAIREGMVEKDLFGRTVAEVIRVVAFDQPRSESYYVNKKTVYVTLKLRAAYNPKRDQYRYEGTLLQVGDWIRLTVQSTVINGIVVMLPAKDRQELKWMTVKTQIKNEGPFLYEPFNETTGIDRFAADAINVGDKATDSDGNVLAEVLDKRVQPASVMTGDQYGNIYDKKHPRKVDVFLTVKVAVRKVGNEWYYLDVLPVKVNVPLPLFLSNIDIEPRITEIVSVSE